MICHHCHHQISSSRIHWIIMSLAAQLCNVVLVITELTQCSVFLSLVKEQGGVARWGKSGDSPFLVPGAHCIFCGKPAFKSKNRLCFESSGFGY